MLVSSDHAPEKASRREDAHQRRQAGGGSAAGEPERIQPGDNSPSGPAALLPGATQSLAGTRSPAALRSQPQPQAPRCPRTGTGGTFVKVPCSRDTFVLNCFTVLGAHLLYSDGSSLTSSVGFLLTTRGWLVFCLPRM